MKKHLFYPAVLAIILLLVFALNACTGAGEGSDDVADTTSTSVDSMTRNNDFSPTTDSSGVPLTKEDSSFLAMAASGGIMEVQLGQLAQRNAGSQRVKDFGNMMIRDHSKANADLKQLASAKNLVLPQAMENEQQREYQNLSMKNGNNFDKNYIKMMVEDHEKDIKEFEKAANNAQDATVRSFAGNTLPVLRMHLDSAKAIQNSIR